MNSLEKFLLLLCLFCSTYWLRSPEEVDFWSLTSLIVATNSAILFVIYSDD